MPFRSPEQKLVRFLQDHVSTVKAWPLVEAREEGTTILPAIIYTPTVAEVIDTYRGQAPVALNFIVDCKSFKYSEARDLRDKAVRALNNQRINGNAVYGRAIETSAEILDMSQTGDEPIYNASFEVAFYY